MTVYNNKFLKHILVLLLFMTSSCSIQAQHPEVVTTANSAEIPSAADSTILPREYVDVICQSDTVTWYLIDAFSETSDSTLKAGIGECLSTKMDVSSESVGAVVATLTYAGAFEDKDYVKDCTFMPDVAMTFTSRNDTVLVAYSFYCDICRFQKADGYKDYDGELIRKTILQLALEMFPNDKYLRTLNRREK